MLWVGRNLTHVPISLLWCLYDSTEQCGISRINIQEEATSQCEGSCICIVSTLFEILCLFGMALKGPLISLLHNCFKVLDGERNLKLCYIFQSRVFLSILIFLHLSWAPNPPPIPSQILTWTGAVWSWLPGGKWSSQWIVNETYNFPCPQ